jgi:hypothetical protein
MNDPQNPKSIRPPGGVFNDLTQYARLVLRLIGDRRVNPLLKLLPVGALAYLVIPDLLLGPVDDAMLVWIGTYLFVELCPPDVVAEHRAALQQVISGEWRDPQQPDDEIIDAEFREQK